MTVSGSGGWQFINRSVDEAGRTVTRIARFDINLAPLEVGNIFCESKSELKFYEAALVDRPTVASPTEPYRNAIVHGQTGFLATTEDEWYEAVTALVVDASVVRQPKAYPVYDDSYQTHVEAVRTEFDDKYPTLHLVGRNGMHKYNNQDHAMMTAMLTVENILAGEKRYDVWQVNEDAEYGEAGLSGAQEALKSVRMVPQRAA